MKKKKNKINFKVILLVILAYLTGIIKFTNSIFEMIVDILIIGAIVDILIRKPKKKKYKPCPFWKTCKLYDPKSKPCNDEGFFGSRFPGCYREMSKKKNNKNKKFKK